MPRTITISDEHYGDALRAILARLKDELEICATEIEPRLLHDTSPLDDPTSHDAHSHLARARRTFEALEALDWPPEKSATKKKRGKR